MKEIYQIDMEETQYSKLLSDIPPVDIVITMGCNVNCPTVSCRHREDWGLEDPTGKSDEEFQKTIKLIDTKILDLANRIKDYWKQFLQGVRNACTFDKSWDKKYAV